MRTIDHSSDKIGIWNIKFLILVQLMAGHIWKSSHYIRMNKDDLKVLETCVFCSSVGQRSIQFGPKAG